MIDEKELLNLSDERLKGRVEGSGDILVMIDNIMRQEEKDNDLLENLRHDVCEYLRSHLKILKGRNKDKAKGGVK